MNDIELRRAADARHHENRARLAWSWGRFDSTGSGSVEFEDAVDFGLTFIEQPYVSTGHSVDTDELAELLGLDEGVAPTLPQVTSYPSSSSGPTSTSTPATISSRRPPGSGTRQRASTRERTRP